MEIARLLIYIILAFLIVSTTENYIKEELTWKGRWVLVTFLVLFGYLLYWLWELSKHF